MNYSPRTVEHYGYYLKRFILFSENCDVKEVLPDHLFKYQRHLYTMKFSPGTQCSNLVVVRMLFRFLIRHQFIETDPTTAIELPRLEKNLPRNILTLDEVKAMIEATEKFTVLKRRNRAIIELFYASGMRVSELKTLTLDSINSKDLTIRVMGKGRKERIIPISGRAIIAVDEYLEYERPKLLNRSKNPKANYNLLMLSFNGNKLYNDSLSIIVRNTAKYAGIKKHITPHNIRHTLATHLLRAGMGIRYIQELLGHADLRTTQIYTQVENKDLIRMVHEYHPMST